MEEQPAVEPVVHRRLEIHEAAVVAPALQFVELATEIAGRIQAQQPEDIVARALIAEPHPRRRPLWRCQVGQAFLIQKFEDHGNRCVLIDDHGGSGFGGSGLRRGRCDGFEQTRAQGVCRLGDEAADVRDLLVNHLAGEPLLHHPRHEVLQRDAEKSADHHDRVKHHERRGLRAAEMEAAMKKDERDGEDRQPDVRAQPELHIADAPEPLFFPNAERRRKQKNCQCERAVKKTERRRAVGVSLTRRVAEEFWQVDFERQVLREKFRAEKCAEDEGGDADENGPRDVIAVDFHAREISAWCGSRPSSASGSVCPCRVCRSASRGIPSDRPASPHRADTHTRSSARSIACRGRTWSLW